MTTLRRQEFRFICNPNNLGKVIEKLLKNPLIVPLCFTSNFTETVYFTKENTKVVDDFYVRLRRYVANDNESVIIGSEPSFLEFKSRGVSGKSVVKDKATVSSRHAAEILMFPERRVALVPRWLPALFPLIATKVKRQHYLFQEIVRITIDPETKLFLFRKDDPFVGRFVETIKEVKIEVKGIPDFDISGVVNELKQVFFGNVEVFEIDKMYMERTIRAHFKGWQK